eukprot:TRINITY_DN2312_c0_g1_i5.p1 TRINITY_DN2312_c0_g1~~TRINITY_DN2312_c0_g1_i5.p1  ORF type:complete len:679 (-),score=170.17 TRINITY_DN2312_c0_g1_i5:73-2109(-)
MSNNSSPVESSSKPSEPSNHKTEEKNPKQRQQPQQQSRRPQRPTSSDKQKTTTLKPAKEASTAPQSNDSRVDVSNLHPFVTEAELSEFFTTKLGVAPKRTKIIFYGPKSTGNGWVEFEKVEDGLRALKDLQGAVLRDKEVTLSMKTKNKIERQIKRAAQKVKKEPRAWDDEVEQVKKKFPDTFKEILSEEDKYRFSVSFPPSDPEFPFNIPMVVAGIEVVKGYPDVPCSVILLNSDIPPKIKQNVHVSIDNRARKAYLGKPMILGLLRFLDVNLEKLFIDQRITQDYILKTQGYELVDLGPKTGSNVREFDSSLAKPVVELPRDPNRREEIVDKLLKPVSAKSNVEQKGDEVEVKQEESAEKKQKKDKKEKEKASEFGTTAHKGTQILVQDKTQEGIGILQCSTLNIVVICQRCRQQNEFSNLTSGIMKAKECDKCHTPQDVTFRPEVMHETAHILGYLDINGCRPFDILPSNFVCNCLECATDVLFNNQFFGPSGQTTINCLNCHHRLVLKIDGFRFFKIRTAPANIDELIAAQPKKKKKDPNMDGIVVGKPLPKKGACKHYKHSHRWLRFPCCGRAFPCDICHDEQMTDGHEVKWASRMICGYCAKEQSCATSCSACKEELTGQANSVFWEGGKGCRNKTFMSNKDPHKYKNSNLKTKSKKAERVGGGQQATGGKK